jgi:signal peptidase I
MEASNDTTRPGNFWRRVAIGSNPRVTLTRIIVLVVVCVVVFKFILLPIRVEGISMLPTYRDGSVNFINRLAYLRHEPQRGDVVGLALGPGNGSHGAPHIMYMKRIVGLPGETVSFSGGKLFINGAALAEPYLKNKCDWNAQPVTNGASQYYVVGDNRSMPRQLHEHGRAEREQIVGEVLF